MNFAVHQYVADILRAHPEVKGDTLEVGSRDVNGTIRDLFTPPRFPSYIGIDMCAGKGVDRVAKADSLPFPDGSFDCVVSTEMLEHDNRFWVSLQEFHRVLRTGGKVLITTRGPGFAKHEFPFDYWRFTAEGLMTALDYAGFQIVVCEETKGERAGTVGTRALAFKFRSTKAYVGGTFDLFHYGHVNFLRRVKERFHRVVVALNNDDFAARYKRPTVMTLAERVEVLKSCRYVDAVDVNESGEDSKPSILRHMPSHIVHGDDWAGEALMKQMGLTDEFLRTHGIEMAYIPYTCGLSTSQLIERVRRMQ